MHLELTTVSHSSNRCYLIHHLEVQRSLLGIQLLDVQAALMLDVAQQLHSYVSVHLHSVL
jgi:hypothetical protein